jgi:hypothetical protein
MNEAYQNYLAYLRESTNMITCSWSMPYRGVTIHGANYNGVAVVTCHLPEGRTIYSKSLTMMKGLIRKQQLGEMK